MARTRAHWIALLYELSVVLALVALLVLLLVLGLAAG
jgi:hypothetical protein